MDKFTLFQKGSSEVLGVGEPLSEKEILCCGVLFMCPYAICLYTRQYTSKQMAVLKRYMEGYSTNSWPSWLDECFVLQS